MSPLTTAPPKAENPVLYFIVSLLLMTDAE